MEFRSEIKPISAITCHEQRQNRKRGQQRNVQRGKNPKYLGSDGSPADPRAPCLFGAGSTWR